MYNRRVIHRLIFVVATSVTLTACEVQPLTPTPAATTPQPPARVAVVTFTPDPTEACAPPCGVRLLPTETPTLAASPTLVILPRPTESVPRVAVVEPVAPPAPTAVPPVALAPPPAADVASAEQYTIDLINAQRAARGATPLARDETLMGIARARVADMVTRGYTGHNDPATGEALGRALMRAAGYTSTYLGENWYGAISAPPGIVEIAMNWFMTDLPHARNILNPNYAVVGVGIAFNGRQWLLVQDFAGQ